MLLKKCLEMKMARTIGAFLEGARLCQTRARDEATIVLVGTKNWDLWAKLEGERGERILFAVVARSTYFHKPLLNLDACAQSNGKQDFLET